MNDKKARRITIISTIAFAVFMFILLLLNGFYSNFNLSNAHLPEPGGTGVMHILFVLLIFTAFGGLLTFAYFTIFMIIVEMILESIAKRQGVTIEHFDMDDPIAKLPIFCGVIPAVLTVLMYLLGITTFPS